MVEADESDRSLLKLGRRVAVLTNAELDHHATYSSRRDVEATFREFLGAAEHAVVWDRPELLALAAGPRVVAVRRGARARRRAARVHARRRRGGAVGPGRPQRAQRRRGADRGARDRRRRRGRRGRAARLLRRRPALRAPRHDAAQGALVVDDYAHHPTEVRATLEAARTLAPRRVIAVFQPHLYSRTRHQAREFGAALALADLPVVTEIYPARERAEDYPGVSGRLVAEAAADAGRRQARRVAAGLRLRRAVPARRAARGRPAAHARRRRHRRAGQEAGRSGSNPRRREEILAGVLVAACALAGGWMWLRDSSARRRCSDVFVTGLELGRGAPDPPGAQERRARHDDAARARGPAARGGRAVPVGRRPRDRRELPAQALDRGARARAGRRDRERRQQGRRLRRRARAARHEGSGLPTLRVGSAPGGRARDRPPDARRARRRGRRAAPSCARADRAPVVRRARADPRPAQRPGPRLRLRIGRRAQVDGGRRGCSPIRAPRAPPTSTCGCPNASPREASDRSSRSPRPPAPTDPQATLESSPTLDP